MTKKAKLIKCPKCGGKGHLTKKPTVSGGRKYIYWYIAHYLPDYVSKRGKLVNRVKWCYLNKERVKRLMDEGLITYES